MKGFTLAAVAALLVLAPWHDSVRAQAPLYAVQDLGSFGGLVPAISGINASGQVVGNVSTFGSMAVRYTQGVGWQSLPGLDTGFSVAAGINANGDVVGYHMNSAGLFAFRYRNGVVEDIAPLPGGTTTVGFGINDAGVVTGYSDATNGIVPFVAAGTIPTAIPSLNGGFAYGCGINASGQVAGVSLTPAGDQHGILVAPGATSALDIASPDGPSLLVTACAIDAAGNVGGQFNRASGKTHAFRYSDTTGFLDLDTVNSSLSNIESIAAGVSAGWYTLADNTTTHAFAHRDADGSFDLNTRIDAPGWVLQAAKAINENGVIAGEGTFNGAGAVFLLTPQNANDTTPPVIAAHADLTAEATSPGGAIVVYSAPATTDAVDGNGVATCTPASGSTFPRGATTVTCNATDAAANAAAATTFKVTVKDTTAPVIAAHGDVTAEATGSGGAIVVYLNPATTDAVDGGGTATCAPASGSMFSLGSTTLTCNATDAAGNAAVATTFKVTVKDTTAPTITSLSATPASIWPANNKMVAVSIAVSAADDVDASPVCTLTSVTGGPSSDIVVTGRFSANVRATKNSDGSVRTYMFNVSCQDRAGNTALGAVSVSVAKDQPSKVYHYNHRLRRFLEGLLEAHEHGGGRDHDRR